MEIYKLKFASLGSLLIALCLAGLSGCGGSDSTERFRQANATNAQRLANLYAQHQRENTGRGPSDESEFRGFIGGINPVILERIGVDLGAINELFFSERDGEALKIRYGLRGNDRSDPVAIVFETVGVNGNRLVAYTQQKVEEVGDDARYQELLAGGK